MVDGSARSRVVVLGYDGVRALDVIGPLEVFAVAVEFGAPYSLALCSPDGKDITASLGMRFGVDMAAAEVDDVDTLIVPGSPSLPHGVPAQLWESVGLLAERAPRRIASVCTGAFVLAERGWLDGRAATTHWRWADALRRRFPAIDVVPNSIYLRDGRFCTSAGVSAGIDLSLALVEEDEGAEIAREVARDLVVFMRRPGGQAQFAAPSPPPVDNVVLRRIVDMVTASPADNHALPELARNAGLSVRQLTRLFNEHIGTTPAAFVASVRLDLARGMLESGDRVGTAARLSGFASDEALRRAFARRYGVTPSQFRSRFRTADRLAESA